jgi:tetratricopeptide (TPR) repeat protein
MQVTEKQVSEKSYKERMESAHVLISEGCYEEAAEELKALIKVYPSEAESYAVLCELCLSLEDAEIPMEWILHAVRHDPSMSQAFIAYSSRLYAENRLKECNKILEALVWANPDNHEAWNDLGVVRFGMEDMVTAEKAFHQALALNPLYGESIMNLSSLQMSTGRRDLAVQTALSAMNDAVEILPELLQDLASLLSRVAPTESIQFLQRAEELRRDRTDEDPLVRKPRI